MRKPLFEAPPGVASAVTNLLAAISLAGFTCLVILLLGAMQWSMGERAGAIAAATSAVWRNGMFPWLLISLVALSGFSVLSVVAMRRAQLEEAAQQRLRRAAQALEIMLEEKDVLLAEIHHRVKNNMQVVVNLLQMEAGQLADPGSRQRLDAVGRRLVLIGHIHERVYAADRFARMDVAAHLAEHCDELSQEHPAAVLRVAAEPLHCGLDTALPLALIAHELVSNALRYGGEAACVAVSIRRKGERVLLAVADGGKGPAPDAMPGMGLMLVDLMVGQIGGKIDRTTTDGHCVQVWLSAALFC